LFLALQTSAVRYTSQIGLEAIPALTSFLCVAAYVRWLKSRQKGQAPGPDGWLVLSAVMLGMTAASKYVYCLAGLTVLVHLTWLGQREGWPLRRLGQVLLVWGGLAVVVFFACDPYLWPRPVPRLAASVGYHFDFAGSRHVEGSGLPVWQPLIYLSQAAGNPDWYLVVPDLVILLLAVAGVGRLWQKEPVYGLWLVISLLFLLAWSAKWPQYVMLSLVPYCLAAGEGIRTLWDVGTALGKRGQEE
jgi:hypothetical protein